MWCWWDAEVRGFRWFSRWVLGCWSAAYLFSVERVLIAFGTNESLTVLFEALVVGSIDELRAL